MSVPNFSVEGKITIVTGASRGIGNALALGFAEAGAPVALVARTVSELEETAERIRAKGGAALVAAADVTKKDQVEAMVEKVVKEFGRIDVLLNVAGGAGTRQLKPPLEITEEFWDELQDRNLKSVFLVNQAVARVMVEQRSGSIVNISYDHKAPHLIRSISVQNNSDTRDVTEALVCDERNISLNRIYEALVNCNNRKENKDVDAETV